MDKEKIAYLAGFFDGEGSIMIVPTFWVSQKKGNRYAYRLHCSACNANPKPVFLLSDLFGGKVYERPVGKNGVNKVRFLISYSWSITSWKALSFLKVVLPYLIVKKEQAELAVVFQERKRKEKDKEGLSIVEEAQYILMKNLKKTN